MTTFEDVVVILPGIGGSVLQKPDGVRWALSGSAIARFVSSFGSSLWDLALSDDDASQAHASDGVRASALLDDLHVIPGLWRIDGYSEIPRRLRRFKLVEGENLRTFPYDWRRDNRAAARRLAEESQVWLAEQRARGAADPKLILVCHSMGGLVARYFLEVLGGWKITRDLVTFGTPFRGSLDALNALSNGVAAPLVGKPLTELLRTFPSVHQLLPTFPAIEDANGDMRRVNELTEAIANVDPAMISDAVAFHREISDQQAQNATLNDYQDQGYKTRPIVGMAQTTLQSARVNGAGFDMLESYGGRDYQGDGTVPYVSAFPAEWEDASDAQFVATKHSSMHNRAEGLTQLDGIVRGTTIDLSAFRSLDDWVALDNSDLYPTGDLSITVRTSDAQPTVRLSPHRSEPDGESIVGEVSADAEVKGGYRAIFRSVPVGAWQLSAETPSARGADNLIVVNDESGS